MDIEMNNVNEKRIEMVDIRRRKGKRKRENIQDNCRSQPISDIIRNNMKF
jgi:hypothetical protein